MATVAVSAVGATTLMPGARTITMDVTEMAAIVESNTTIGIADSDVYFESPAAIDAALDQMQAMGVDTVRIGIPWAGINPIPGYYDWSQSDYLINAADERGMGILAVITTTPGYAQNGSGVYSEPISAAQFGEFAGLAAERYAGQVGAYEIWNEPNAAPYYGPTPDPAGYTELLQAAYPAIKAADPDVTVIGGVVGSTITYQDLTLNPVTFVEQMYASGAQGYFDALSFHPYQYTTPFSEGGYHPDSPINQLAEIRALMVANGDADKLVWASEYGQPSSVAGDEVQAAYLQDMLTTWRTLDYTGPAFVYTLEDDLTGSSNPEDTFGLIRSDGTWKPAAYVVQDLATSPSTTPSPADLVELATVTEPTVTEPTLVEPTLAEPTLAEPTLVEPTLVEPTLTEPSLTEPTSDLDAVRSVDLDAVSEPDTATEPDPTTETGTDTETATTTGPDTTTGSDTTTGFSTPESATSADSDTTSTESATSAESTSSDRDKPRRDRTR